MTITTTGIILLYSLTRIDNPDWTQGPEISERIFESHAECAEFVNQVGDDGTNTPVVKEDYTFKFLSSDGIIFHGGCYGSDDIKKLMEEQQI